MAGPLKRNPKLGSRLHGAPDGLRLTAGQFNALIEVGRAVRYYPVAGEPEFVDTNTRSQAWTLGHGEVVVSIDGKAGGVAISHLELLIDSKSDEPETEGPKRPEVGPMQFGDDWPGVFIRGDSAAFFAMTLQSLLPRLKGTKDELARSAVEGLIDTLTSSDVARQRAEQLGVTKLLPFEQCLIAAPIELEVERRAPVQASTGPRPRPAGTISWAEHETAWNEYARRYSAANPGFNTLDSVEGPVAAAKGGGFAYDDLVSLLGFEPKTWRQS